jgi:3-oxoacyl-[acyl-carrier-protein] synthase III
MTPRRMPPDLFSLGSRRDRLGECWLRIQGSGAARPVTRLSSDEVDRRCGRPTGWTSERFAIESRAVAANDETSSALGAEAANRALAAAGWRPDQIDVLIGACGVMEQPIPGTAALIQRRLGLGDSGIPAFDVNATCLSFLAALDVVSLGFRAGRWKKALVVSADIASAALDFDNPEASVIFGDGAAAIALEATAGPSALLGYRLETYADDADLCRLEAGGTRVRPKDDLDTFLSLAHFQMDGPGVFKATARRFPAFMARLLDDCGVSLDDLALIVPHQASAAALEHLRRALPIPRERVVDIFADHGNQIAASMPSALHAALSTGRLKRGDTALLVGSAAGLSLGGAVLRY